MLLERVKPPGPVTLQLFPHHLRPLNPHPHLDKAQEQDHLQLVQMGAMLDGVPARGAGLFVAASCCVGWFVAGAGVAVRTLDASAATGAARRGTGACTRVQVWLNAADRMHHGVQE